MIWFWEDDKKKDLIDLIKDKFWRYFGKNEFFYRFKWSIQKYNLELFFCLINMIYLDKFYYELDILWIRDSRNIYIFKLLWLENLCIINNK